MFSKKFSHQRVPSVPLTPRPFSPSIIASSSTSQTSVEIHTVEPTPENSPQSTIHCALPPHCNNNNTTTTTNNPSHTTQCRWSDVVPPNSALTFAVVWDPQDEIIAFSGAQLFEASSPSSSSTPNSTSTSNPTDSQTPTDACSQILTIPFSENTGATYTGTLQYFRENHEWLFNDDFDFDIDNNNEHGTGAGTSTSTGRDRFRIRSRWSRLKSVGGGGHRTQTSSTMGEMDVYLRGSLMGVAHPDNKKFNSCFGVLDGGFEFDPRLDFEEMWEKMIAVDDRRCHRGRDVDDEGFFEVEFVRKTETSLKRSRSPLSPRNQENLHDEGHADDGENDEDEDEDDLSWQTIESPDQGHRLSIAYFNMLHPNEARHPKLLKKRRRPSDAPCHPAEVLQREVFSHQVSLEPELRPSPTPSGGPPTKDPRSPIEKLYRTLSVKRNKGLPLERWVCVEVVEERAR